MCQKSKLYHQLALENLRLCYQCFFPLEFLALDDLYPKSSMRDNDIMYWHLAASCWIAQQKGNQYVQLDSDQYRIASEAMNQQATTILEQVESSGGDRRSSVLVQPLDVAQHPHDGLLAESKGKGAVVGKKKMGLGKNRVATNG
jgi:hypothetical protein